MAYRLTKKAAAQRAKLEAMRRGRDRARMNRTLEDRPIELPDLRMRVTIERFDFGHKVHVLDLYKSDRIDCYRVIADGVEWKKRIGWSGILVGLRKSMPRVGAG